MIAELEPIIGAENHIIEWWQSCIRAFLMFIIGLLLVRIAGIRTFGKKSAVDNITIFILGSLLARSITGNSPFFQTVLAGLVIVLVHRLINILSYHFKGFGHFVKGRNVLIFEKGDFLSHKMQKHCITKEEVAESVRRRIHSEDFGKVDKIYFEPSGRISVIEKI